MRFVIVLIVLALIALAALFVYGQMLEPEQELIEENASNAGA